jgi:hypothetical protein
MNIITFNNRFRKKEFWSVTADQDPVKVPATTGSGQAILVVFIIQLIVD